MGIQPRYPTSPSNHSCNGISSNVSFNKLGSRTHFINYDENVRRLDDVTAQRKFLLRFTVVTSNFYFFLIKLVVLLGNSNKILLLQIFQSTLPLL